MSPGISLTKMSCISELQFLLALFTILKLIVNKKIHCNFIFVSLCICFSYLEVFLLQVAGVLVGSFLY